MEISPLPLHSAQSLQSLNELYFPCAFIEPVHCQHMLLNGNFFTQQTADKKTSMLLPGKTMPRPG